LDNLEEGGLHRGKAKGILVVIEETFPESTCNSQAIGERGPGGGDQAFHKKRVRFGDGTHVGQEG
jgi:hypothetical protein